MHATVRTLPLEAMGPPAPEETSSEGTGGDDKLWLQLFLRPSAIADVQLPSSEDIAARRRQIAEVEYTTGQQRVSFLEVAAFDKLRPPWSLA